MSAEKARGTLRQENHYKENHILQVFMPEMECKLFAYPPAKCFSSFAHRETFPASGFICANKSYANITAHKQVTSR